MAEEKKESIPKIMNAAVYSEFGKDPALVKLQERQVPVPRTDECLIRVYGASINPIDFKYLAGGYTLVMNVPFVPGFDVAGIVVQCGSAVKKFKVGDEIWADANFRTCGTFAEYVAVDVRTMALKPKNISFKDAASFPLAALTSYQSLLKGEIKKGSKVLILGGSGGTGSLAVQFAKHGFEAGHVAVTCSEANAEWIKSLGADQIIDYKTQKWWEVLKGQQFDIIYDCVGGYEPWQRSPEVLKRNGNYVTICGDGGGKLTVGRLLSTAASGVNRKFWSLFSGPNYYTMLADNKRPDQLDVVKEWVEAGKVKSVLTQTFPLSDVAKLFELSMSQRTRGKAGLAVVSE